MEELNAGGGISTSNNFIVRFGQTAGIGIPEDIGDLNKKLEFFCDETQLPNVNTFEGTMNGIYQGSGAVKYPHTRVFTEIQMSFALDANVSLLKYLNLGQNYIFNGSPGAFQNKPGDFRPKLQNRTVKLNYMDMYVCDIMIMKVEPGPYGDSQRVPITYVLERAYPYQIDAVPLQFGTSQQTKVTAQFAYARHYTINEDIRNVKGFSTADQTKLLDAQEFTGRRDLANANSDIA